MTANTINKFSKEENGHLCKFNKSGMVMDTTFDNFIALDIGNNKFKLMPSPEFNFYLYRGQNIHHKPCVSSIDREYSKEKRLINHLKKIEFIELLKKYPILKDLEEYKILNCTFENDYEGLAQHYGFMTSHLDLTNSKNIAMFFATTKYINGKYEIITSKQKGILYKFNYVKEYERINIIGAQGLARPTMQKGFSINLNTNEDFNKIVESYETIDITKEKSEYYFNMFDGGSKLMPNDIITKKANMILDKNSISLNSIKIYLNKFNIHSKNEIINILKDYKYDLSSKDIKFTKKELINITKQWMKNDKQAFMNKIKFRGTSPHYQG